MQDIDPKIVNWIQLVSNKELRYRRDSSMESLI